MAFGYMSGTEQTEQTACEEDKWQERKEEPVCTRLLPRLWLERYHEKEIRLPWSSKATEQS